MKAYVLRDRNDECCGVFSSVEKATEYAINCYCNSKRKGIYDSIEFLRTEMSEDGKYIDVYFSYKEKEHEDEEWKPYKILIRVEVREG